MLERMRRVVSGWLAYVIIGMLIISFSLWGIGDVFSPGFERTVAKVGSEEITDTELRTILERAMRYSEYRGELVTPAAMREQGLDRQALSLLLSQRAVDIASDDMGLTASTERIAESVRTDSRFFGPFGGFDRNVFLRSLAELGLSEAEYASERRKEHTRRQIQALLDAPQPVPQSLFDYLLSWQAERRVVQYAVLLPSMVEAPDAPDEAGLEEFFNANPRYFTTPERRSFTVLVLTPENLPGAADISRTELEEEYAIGNFAEPEKRRSAQIIFPSLSEAESARQRIADGDTFADVATSRGLVEGDIVTGVYLRSDYISEALGDAVWALDEGGVSEPVDTPLGYVLVEVNEIIPARTPSLEETENELRRRIMVRRGSGEIEALYDTVEDALAGGSSLAEIGRRISIAPVYVNDLETPADLPSSLAAIAGLLQEVFAAAADEESTAQTLEGGYYWLEMREVNPSRLPSFAEVREKAGEIYQQSKRAEALRALADDIASRAASGVVLESLLTAYGRAPLYTDPVPRDFTDEVFAPGVIDRLFNLKRGEFTYAPAAAGDGLVVMGVARILSLRLPGREELDKLRDLVAQTRKREATQQFVGSLQDRYGIFVDEEVLETLFAPQQQFGY